MVDLKILDEAHGEEERNSLMPFSCGYDITLGQGAYLECCLKNGLNDFSIDERKVIFKNGAFHLRTILKVSATGENDREF